MSPHRPLRSIAVAGAVAALLVGCGLAPSTSPVDSVEFETPLVIPPLAESTAQNGVRVFELTAQEGETAFTGGDTTATRGFNGSFLGPTVRAERGEVVAFRIANELSDETTVHWHGMHLPPDMDGGPHQPIAPGETWEPSWTIDQPAATLWYHPHPHGATEQQVYQGLAGLFLLDDEHSSAAALPQEYGVDDIPVIVQDRDVDLETGQVLHDRLGGDGTEVGLLGNIVMTNGVIGAYWDVTTDRVRLRLLNGSTARTYSFGFEDRSVTLVASDGGLMPEPVVLDEIRLSPGERAEIVVEMEPGERAMLRSFPPDLGNPAAGFAAGEKDEFDVLELRAADELQASDEPAWTYDDVGLAEADATVEREFELNGRRINGAEMDMSRIDEVVEMGSTEIWSVRNGELNPHNFHVHDVQFEVLTIDGEAPPAELSGRKDTIYLEPHREYRLLMRFEDFANPDVPYMYHCHLLQHEDAGLMGQFVVVEPGEGLGEVPDHDH
ncbi:multicopper oxidase domain-containing protein [uncultured Agrococcus sp.]|uniref:multicopper oxidase family protein n=1 Tax=uncultured Agrococcus sp. TaxID=382258 RepID=UPI0025D5A644|nr:multicopper oxidase domain-containing protein [uncultured Agrococcus sp.]